MSSASEEIMDLEDLTPRQLRKMIGKLMRARLPSHEKTADEREEDAKKAEKANDDLADLMAEGKNTNTPKVTKDDLPKSGDDKEDDKDKSDKKSDDKEDE